jgi:hypothetical protein
LKFASHAVAPSNMVEEDVSAGVDQPVMSWAKAEASLNIQIISFTPDVSKLASGWLKAEADQNMKPISFTLDVFHRLTSALNVDLPKNARIIEETRDTSQSGIAPNSLDEHIPSTGFELKHAVMAAAKFTSVMSGGGGGRGVEVAVGSAAAEEKEEAATAGTGV